MSAPFVVLNGLGGRLVNLGDLFARIPDAIVLSVATRDYNEMDPHRCLCGWALREQIALASGVDADSVVPDPGTVVQRCAAAFGGEWVEWATVFSGVTDHHAPAIEAAWVNRIEEALETSDVRPIVYNTKRKRVTLPPDLYDALELAAFAFGGVGAGRYGAFDDSAVDGAPVNAVEAGHAVPVCAVGLEAFAGTPGDWWRLLKPNTVFASDQAVRSVNRAKGVYPGSSRITFEEWVSELNIRRGDA